MSAATHAWHNQATGNVWLALEDGTTRPLGAAASRSDLAQALLGADLVRMSDWMLAGGRMRVCRVRSS